MASFSVVIPVYNESKVIKNNLSKVDHFMKNFSPIYEIIVVNDGSKDNTLDEVKKVKSEHIRIINYAVNKGKGYAVRQGVLSAKYDYVLFLDADLATPIEELKSFTKYISDYDVIIASRSLPTSKIENPQPFFRRTFGAVGKKIINFLLISDIKDTQCGFKLFKKDVALKIFKEQEIERWGFDFEVLFLAKKHKYTIKEVPITWYGMKDSKLKTFDYFTTLVDLLKIKIGF